MLTKLSIRNFKRFENVEIELGNPVVFIGPNNSGKTSAMQALTLWEIGLKRWNERRAGQGTPEKRPGVAINRRDLLSVPVPNAALLWRQLHTRDMRKVEGRLQTNNIRIDVIVEGITSGREWRCGLEFDYANDESLYCRPLRTGEDQSADRMPVPPEAGAMHVAYLPPMSGLAATETRLEPGAVNVRVGEGRTAEVLRNLCFRIFRETSDQWNALAKQIRTLFGAELEEPRYVEERGEITMGYREDGIRLDLSSSGRGLQQTLLILAYMYANPGAVVLLDEPDAHLEILRQRQIYNLLVEAASVRGNQIIAASHSEILLNEATGKDLVVAFVGQPHRMKGGKDQVRKALADIGFEQYLQAEQCGWVLYLEGSTDLAIVRAFAERLGHEATQALERPFVHYVGNQPQSAAKHFFGLKEAFPDLKGVALFDRLDSGTPDVGRLQCLSWKKWEIENYLCTRETLEAYASASEAEPMPLFVESEIDTRLKAMAESVTEIEQALMKLGRGSPWDADVKVSDDFLNPLFSTYFRKLHLPNFMEKKSFYVLAAHVPEHEIDPEIGEKLDEITRVANAVERHR